MTPPTLTGTCVIVTGGGRGLGFAMSSALVRAGANVVICGARDADGLAAAAAALRAMGPGDCASQVADVTSPDQCEALAALAVERFGAVDTLVNNAGRGGRELAADGERPTDLWSVDPARYLGLLASNIAGPWMMARAVVPAMIARGRGRIVNISTSRSTMTLGGSGPYGPSKAALEASSRIWGNALAASGVDVAVLLPGGSSDTGFIPGEGVGSRAVPWWPERAGTLVEGSPGGILPPEVMAAPIVWLASPASRGVTGIRIVGANWPPGATPEAALALAASPLPG